MNSIAQQALDRALGKALPTPTDKHQQTRVSDEVQACKSITSLSKIVITGPINRVMELEGKRYALEFVRSLGSSIRREPIRTKAIADLTKYAAMQRGQRREDCHRLIEGRGITAIRLTPFCPSHSNETSPQGHGEISYVQHKTGGCLRDPTTLHPGDGCPCISRHVPRRIQKHRPPSRQGIPHWKTGGCL